jgi:hypothetical protein
MYRITINKITTEEVEEKNYERIADTGNKEDGGAVYGYVPKKTTREIERNILSQEVEDLDIEEVIKAINKIK